MKKSNMIIIAIVLIIVIAVISVVAIKSKKTDNNEEDGNIVYTHKLNYNIYTDENGDYVKEYENGDKTIQTKRK